MVFIVPALIGFVVFYLYPAIRGFYLSMTKYNLLNVPKFIGLNNYSSCSPDPLFWNSLRVTA